MAQAEVIWNARYTAKSFKDKVYYEPWLNRWEKYFPAKDSHTLDIGCGLGLDTEVLLRSGFRVTAIDFSEGAIALSKQRNPKATHFNRDISKGIGLKKNSFSLIVANLSLHYFSETQTRLIFREIVNLMEEKGFFLFRVNAVSDKNDGSADRKEEWELVDVGGVSKQFFTETMIKSLAQDFFDVISLEQMTTNRFGKEKMLLECVTRKK